VDTYNFIQDIFLSEKCIQSYVKTLSNNSPKTDYSKLNIRMKTLVK